MGNGGETLPMRLFLYIIFSTAGMASIAISLLAPVMTVYYTDQGIIDQQENKLASLKKLYQQQQQLLGNLNDPVVIERAAENNLNYVPADIYKQKSELPRIWPELQRALDQIDKQPTSDQPSAIRKMARVISDDKIARNILLVLGGLLTVISLTFFHGKPDKGN